LLASPDHALHWLQWPRAKHLGGSSRWANWALGQSRRFLWFGGPPASHRNRRKMFQIQMA